MNENEKNKLLSVSKNCQYSCNSKNPNDSNQYYYFLIMKLKFKNFYKRLTNHDYDDCFGSFNNFVNFMYKPIDGSSLGIGRMLFGLMMLLDIPDERSGADLDYRWGEPRDCRFPLFSFLKPFSLPKMGLIYAVMWLGKFFYTYYIFL